ncbi:MAG TPA: 16S rRNA (cytidine(1402)-2'-O)-methyltransferase, partial [Clostridiales bacterium]|nr:16S rRNA (cytidine(1402)-2'-O)-methyltransferase [Clostridiales bacterium]
RVTLKLLNPFDIKKPLVSYHEHNKRERGAMVADRILKGETCALVSDAGMPCISDPGTELVNTCIERGIPVLAVPGPSAVITALAVSGLNVSRFTFEGFLSVNKSSRKKHLEEIKGEKRTMVFYEAPHKLPRTLKDLYETLGDRRIALVKELTKIYEQVERTTLAAAAEKYSQQKPKGEFVLIIEGREELKSETEPLSAEDAAELARQYIEEGLSPTEAAKKAAKESGHKKNDIYRLLTSD